MSYIAKAGGATMIKITAKAIGTSEVSHVLQDNLQGLTISVRGALLTLGVAFAPGETTNYKTVYPGSQYVLSGIMFTGKTVYITASGAGTAEIEELYSP